MLKTIKFKGRYFAEEANLEILPESDRLSIIYGKNGSGKSTIADAIIQAAGNAVIEGIDYANIYDENGALYSEKDSIHVFNEDYVNARVKVKDDGLKTIVLLGELGDLEDKIQDTELRIEAETNKNKDLKTALEELQDRENPKSAAYCRSQMNFGLSGDTHWAGREKRIKNHKRNASVTDSVLDGIICLQLQESIDIIRERYDKNIILLNQVRENEAEKLNDTVPLTVSFNEERLQELLKQKVESPKLSDREEKILRMIEDGKADNINEMRRVFSKDKTTHCPYCFQEVTTDYKKGLIESIERVFSKEFDEHQEKLEKSIILEVEVDFNGYDAIDSKMVLACKNKVEEINKEIIKIREIILKKINHPYTPITDFETELTDRLEEYEELRKKLQNEIDKYNEAVGKVGILEKKLSDDNALIAHYELASEIDRWEQAKKDLEIAKKAVEDSNKEIKEKNDVLELLRAKKKNIKIAVNLINNSLRYVFFSKDRLEIKVENEKYVLYSRGIPVKPNNVSLGERNIIALCYFFTELISNQEAKDGYTKKSVVIIDDPVSSFDIENKVGIMSLLKNKVSSIIKNNDESQVVVLTHDMQCYYDFHKIAKEIAIEVKTESDGHIKFTYKGRELKNKELVPLSYKPNEYSELLKKVYIYACGKTSGLEYTIGNIMRRILEAFSTFTYKKGIEEVSIDDSILACIDDKDYVEYFKNLMYRLVLHGESHMEERVKALQDPEYLDFISNEEKERTAQEVICFMYKLNSKHVLAHLDGESDVEINIKNWLDKIKEFYIEK
jgi:wobble nucleotide-excising tRNase